jgi:hypothetical protein
MVGRIGRGWGIAKQSWQIVCQDKALLPFPILSAISTLLVIASFISPVLFVPGLSHTLAAELEAVQSGHLNQNTEILCAVAGFLFYAANYFVIVFFNTALAACAAQRFRGETPTVGGGLRVAVTRLPQIIGWVLLAATVGTLLRVISERSRLIGKIVTALFGVTWTIATYLVIPTLAVEGLGPIKALRRSSSLVSKSWGEGLVGTASMGWFGFLLLLPSFLVAIPALFAFSAAPGPMSLMIGFGVLLFLTGLVLLSAMKQVFIVGLYLYASENQVPHGFSPENFKGAFRAR